LTDHASILLSIAILLAAYLLGAIPVGLLIVRWRTGKDLRAEHSGRTGGTNAMRAAGWVAGVLTGVGDLAKGALAVLLARQLSGGNEWLAAGAGLMAILGHNYSVFLMERGDGALRFRGGAGGAPTVGATMAIWPVAGLVGMVFGLGVLFSTGYASLGTLAAGLTAAVMLTWRAVAAGGSWAGAFYGIGALVLLVVALLPNIRRLLAGSERPISLRRTKAQPGE
jgi:acyl phosphate:glycerol-3-phosphate acyltransferase